MVLQPAYNVFFCPLACCPLWRTLAPKHSRHDVSINHGVDIAARHSILIHQ